MGRGAATGTHFRLKWKCVCVCVCGDGADGRATVAHLDHLCLSLSLCVCLSASPCLLGTPLGAAHHHHHHHLASFDSRRARDKKAHQWQAAPGGLAGCCGRLNSVVGASLACCRSDWLHAPGLMLWWVVACCVLCCPPARPSSLANVGPPGFALALAHEGPGGGGEPRASCGPAQRPGADGFRPVGRSTVSFLFACSGAPSSPCFCLPGARLRKRRRSWDGLGLCCWPCAEQHCTGCRTADGPRERCDRDLRAL